MIITFVILALTIALFIAGRLRSDLVALAALLALFLTGVLNLDQALAGFGNPTVIMIAALFIVGDGLSRTGVTAWLGERMLILAGSSRVKLLVILMVGTALLSAFISNTGTVATLMPAITAAAWRIGSYPAAYLMPLAFSANTGGLLTLTGTPPNLIINEALIQNGIRPLGYFEFALIGAPLLLGAVGYMLLLGRRLLPERRSGERPQDLVESMGALAEDYTLEGSLYRLRVRGGSSLIGRTLDEIGLGRDYGVSVLRVERPAAPLERLRAEDASVLPGARTTIEGGDLLLVKGTPEGVNKLMARFQVGVQPVEADGDDLASMLLSHEFGIAEVIIAPRSVYIGKSVSQAQFSQKFGVQVMSLRRQDRALDLKQERLRFGDSLLVRGSWENIELLRGEARNFVVVGTPEAMVRQIVQLSPQSMVAVLALTGMVVLMVGGWVPTVIAALMAAVFMVIGRCLNMEQAYRSVNWQSVILIACMIPMSTALQLTGGAQLVADSLVETLGAVGHYALLAGIFVLTAALSQVINNSATAVLMTPIVLQAAADLGASPYPFLLIVTISASTAFLTPIGTTTNLMVTPVGGYRFQDFARVGLPLSLLFLLMSILLVPIIWPL